MYVSFKKISARVDFLLREMVPLGTSLKSVLMEDNYSTDFRICIIKIPWKEVILELLLRTVLNY